MRHRVDAMNRKAFVYTRVSTDRQDHSLVAQEGKNGDYCKLADLDVAATFTDEAVSGRTPLAQRPGGRALIAAFKATPGVRDLVVAKLDRLGRSATDIGNTIDWLMKCGIQPHIVDLRVDCSTAFGKFLVQILAAVAELEVANTRDRIRVVLSDRRRRGFVVGTVPYGYRDVESGGERRLEENPDEMPVLLRMVAWRTAGWGYDRIATQLGRERVPTKTPAGQPYSRGGRHLLTTGKWNAGTVRRILANSYTTEITAKQIEPT